ncbi:hypothetical protein [Alteromonas sp. ASW11-130]|uniref:hypothetical protein n=1 Tax=Alteromonas sp. ASW11-130 TaxID=3015775 RepID=UPI002241A9E6|nr:hypothetical protein [Alteromonas sp. ASW11-130]MCW8093441.1 hypothetical protein [Alteromonas sp. ASW11-130]
MKKNKLNKLFTLLICFYCSLMASNVQSSANPFTWNLAGDIAVSPAGNKVAINCHNCYNGPQNQILTLAQANAKINTAIARGSNFIELDVGFDGQKMCVSHEPASRVCSTFDSSKSEYEPLLNDILANPTLLNSTASLAIEVKSITSGNTDGFVTEFLTVLSKPSFSKYFSNGREVLVRGFHYKIPTLLKIKNAAAQGTFGTLIANKLKYSVLYWGVNWGGLNSINALQSSIYNDVYKNNLHFVEFKYQMKDLLGASQYAKSLGLGVGVGSIPVANGDAFVAALREEFDLVTSDYRVDYAKNVIKEKNLLAYLNAATCTNEFDNQLYFHVNYWGGAGTIARPVDRAPTSTLFGYPQLHYDSKGQDRFSCSLDFRTNQGLRYRAVNLGQRSNTAGNGFLVSAYVNFDKLSNFSEGVMALVSKAESGGFALELANSGGKNIIRFGVRVNGKYRYKTYDIASTGLGGLNQRINGSDGYFIVGAYDGDGGLYLWIDNKRDNSLSQYAGGVESSNVNIFIGADPQPSASRDTRFFFDGLIQHVSVIDWGHHPSGTN